MDHSASNKCDGAVVYKVMPKDAWDDACASGIYRGSADDARDGFIHLSSAEQLAGTTRKYFFRMPDLVLIAYSTASLGAQLKWEPSRGGALFPHYYGALKTGDAVWVRDLPLGPDGAPVIPEDLS